jgi:signal transduction histidine kinase
MKVARRLHRIYHRLYLHGLLLLALVSLALLLLGAFFGREPRWHRHPERLVRHLAGLLTPLPDAAQAQEVARLAAALDVALAVYRVDGTRLASAGGQGLPALGVDQATRLLTAPGRVHRQHLDVSTAAGPGRYLRLSFRQTGREVLHGMLLVLALVVVVLAVVSAPLARALARPIEHLAETARRLGAGDLDARSGLQRDDEIGALARAFDEMAERLGHLVQGQRELLSNVSHELRTPLARLRVTLALAAEAEPARARACLEEMEIDIVELEQLVSDLLAAARLEATGALALRRAGVDPEAWLGEALARFARRHPERQVEWQLAACTPLEADAGLLGRLLDNLLDNAAKYSEPSTKLALQVAQVDRTLVLTLRDQGTGIAPEHQARLFTPFFRADASRARQSGGVGLGLLFCKRIVEAHGGRIAIESQLGVGTTVRVELPVNPPASAALLDGPRPASD